MFSVKYFFSFALFVVYSLGVHGKTLPSYITVCKRDPETVSSCVRDAIEVLKPKLAEGIPELKVPGIEPFIIPEFAIDQGNTVLFKAVGRDVKVYGASNFKLKYLDVDLDRLQIKARITIPRLFIEGKYDVDARLLVLPIHGKGDITATATKCVADVILQAEVENKDGVEYLKFTAVDLDIDIQDYNVKITGLYNGNTAIGDVANQVINNNKAEILKTSKPYIERSTSNMFKKLANRIVTGFTFDELLPKE